MDTKPILLWYGDNPAPANVLAAASEWEITARRLDEPFWPSCATARLALVHPNGRSDNVADMEALLDRIEAAPGLSVLLLPPDARIAWGILNHRKAHCLALPDDTPAEELAAKFEALGAVQPLVRDLQEELSSANRVSIGAANTVASLNEEMQLAAKLQRDFLPHPMPQVPPVRFHTLFRPAGWLSGDIYDVARLDETHIGFYVADAVGHGLSAALLTMFIKKALQTKRITGSSYEIISPEMALQDLNAAICRQDLSSCPFCTAVYGILNIHTLEMTYCRAGHPAPVLIRADDAVESLDGEGSLLGIFSDATFEARTVRLARGDRLLLYTDGVEDALRPNPTAPRVDFTEAIDPWRQLSGEELIRRLEHRVDAHAKAHKLLDDVTVIAVGIEP